MSIRRSNENYEPNNKHTPRFAMERASIEEESSVRELLDMPLPAIQNAMPTMEEIAEEERQMESLIGKRLGMTAVEVRQAQETVAKITVSGQRQNQHPS